MRIANELVKGKGGMGSRGGRTHEATITFRLSLEDKAGFRSTAADNINPRGHVMGNKLRLMVKAYNADPRRMDLFLEAYRRYDEF